MSTSNLSDLTAACIRCGFCLESCPTFQLTGDESQGPRGRIYLARNADEGEISWKDAAPALDTCLGCLACETACPSNVQYGEILELARKQIGGKASRSFVDRLTDPSTNHVQFALSWLLPDRRIPGLVSTLLHIPLQIATVPQPDAPEPWPPLNIRSSSSVNLLLGCLMNTLFPGVHEATRRLLLRVGVATVGVSGCCGALHAHIGEAEEAQKKLNSLTKCLDSERLILTNAAGCGSHLQHELGTARSQDASVYLYNNGLVDQLKQSQGFNPGTRITYHDACHLAHGQGVRSEPRELLKAIPGVEFVELENSDRCCGSAGTYNIFQPKMAKQLLDQKVAEIKRTGAEFVVMGNPGCQTWIAQGLRGHGINVIHTLEFVESAFSGLRS